jgi:hypothetical protein
MRIRRFASVQFAVLPYLPLSPHGSRGPVAHPLLSLVIVGAVCVLVYQAFRRRPS